MPAYDCQDAQSDLKALMKKGTKRTHEEKQDRETKKEKKRKPKKEEHDDSPHVPTPSHSAEESSEKEPISNVDSEDSSDLDKDVFERGFEKKGKKPKKDRFAGLSEKGRKICQRMNPALVHALPANLSKQLD